MIKNFKLKIKNYLERLQNLPETQKKAILWTIVIIMLAVMGFFWIRSASDKLSKIGEDMKNVQLPQVEMPGIQPNDLTGEKVEDQTTDWKTYTDSQYGYEIKYPSDWHQISQNVNNALVFLDFCPNTDNNCESSGVYVIVYKSEVGKRVLDSYREQGPGYNEEKITVDGQDAIKRQKSYCNGVPLLDNSIFIDKNNYVYQIEGPFFACGTDKKIINEDYKKIEDIFNQILLTFKFTK